MVLFYGGQLNGTIRTSLWSGQGRTANSGVAFEKCKFPVFNQPLLLLYFHAIRAVNALDGFDSSKHSGVIAHFNQEYVKTGVFEKGASKIIRNASELREQADYEDFYEATQEEASDVFMQASQFISEVERYLHSKAIL